MIGTETPIGMFHRQTQVLRAHMPGVLDGSVESIHKSRIATRRLRALLPLMREWQRRPQDDIVPWLRRVGRSLGRVRDADTRIELLRYLESRILPAAPSLELIRQNQERERLALMRKLVRRLERLDVERELAHLAGCALARRARLWTALTGAWRARLRDLVAERADAVRDAIAHATGVYFPQRAHQARIAIKKCRYTAEIAIETGVLTDIPIVRDLRKAQDILGDLHDRQTLLDCLSADRADRVAKGGADADQTSLVRRVAEADINDLYRRFLQRRPPLLASIDAVRRAAERGDRAAALAVTGVVVIGVGLEALRRRQHTRRLASPAEPDRSVSVRIPVALGHGSGDR